MKTGLLSGIALLLLLAATQPEKTEVIVIGTVHHPTANVDGDSLLAVLNMLQPSLVLLELDASAMDEEGRFLVDLSLNNELYAAKHYLLACKTCQQRRFDYESRNRYFEENRTFAVEQRVGQLLDSLAVHGTASVKQRINMLYDANDLLNRFTESSLQAMNEDAFGHLAAFRQEWLYVEMSKVLAEAGLKKAHEAWVERGRFWTFRNEQMANNIEREVKQHRGRRVVVLVGATHKYALQKHLESRFATNPEISLREYWETEGP